MGPAVQPSSTYPFPPIEPNGPSPIWDGKRFRVGDSKEAVLRYEASESGWTDELTAFHEDAAGSNHPIEITSRAIALAALSAIAPREGAVILEAGCSSGYMLDAIRARHSNSLVIGSDYVHGPLDELARRGPGLPLLQFDLTGAPYRQRASMRW